MIDDRKHKRRNMYKYGTVSNIEEELDKVISGNIWKNTICSRKERNIESQVFILN